MSLPTKPLQRSQSLHEQTYQVLRESILSGELAPGDRLVETQLAAQLQVSRTPIREAIRQLQREELLTTDPHGGLRVTAISVTDAIHLYDCRIALETLATVNACEKASPSCLEQLRNYVMQAERLTQGDPSEIDSTQLLEVDYQFHRSIAESSGNKWLVSLLDRVFDKMTLLRARTAYKNPKVLEIQKEHQLICDAIAQRDGVAATQAIQNHLNASKARVIQEIEQLKL